MTGIAASAASQAAPGALGFLVVAGMGVILFFLFRSMTRHLRKVSVSSATAVAASSPGGATSSPGVAAASPADAGRVSTGSARGDLLANGPVAGGPAASSTTAQAEDDPVTDS
ncbi:MAG: hypothetical protein ABJB47_08485 [Actinomycetota bacterium]